MTKSTLALTVFALTAITAVKADEAGFQSCVDAVNMKRRQPHENQNQNPATGPESVNFGTTFSL